MRQWQKDTTSVMAECMDMPKETAFKKQWAEDFRGKWLRLGGQMKKPKRKSKEHSTCVDFWITWVKYQKKIFKKHYINISNIH